MALYSTVYRLQRSFNGICVTVYLYQIQIRMSYVCDTVVPMESVSLIKTYVFIGMYTYNRATDCVTGVHPNINIKGTDSIGTSL